MHFHRSAFAMATCLAVAVVADVLEIAEPPPGSLSLAKRQDTSYAFRPNPRTRQGTNCAATFGAGYLQCNPSGKPTKRCYNPAMGHTCCEETCKLSLSTQPNSQPIPPSQPTCSPTHTCTLPPLLATPGNTLRRPYLFKLVTLSPPILCCSKLDIC
jgi:hypothetical protein